MAQTSPRLLIDFIASIARRFLLLCRICEQPFAQGIGLFESAADLYLDRFRRRDMICKRMQGGAVKKIIEERGRMKGRILFLIGFCFFLGSTLVFGQDKKFEINGQLGFTFSEGVDIDSQKGDELGVERLSPKSAFSYGLGLDYYLNENFAIGFNFAQERSKLRARVEDLEGVDITNMNVDNYHAILTYNFFDEDSPLRPFIFGGLGATNYSPDSIDGNAIEGGVKFSTTWGGGVKYYTTESLGFKAGMRWTPTRINEVDGIYCSEYWPWDCWIMSHSNFSHQFELNAGVVVRF
jgi:hypothetical protein